jgi:uncharacterized protein (TIGR00369 family)
VDRLAIDVKALIAAQLAGEVPPAPVEDLLGLRFVSWGDGEAVFELDAEPRHANPTGIVQGGVVCALADAAMATAFASTLEEGETFTTLELKMNYVKPVREGRIAATGHVVHRGRTTGVLECTVLDADERLVAKATSTLLILRRTT